MRWSGLWADCAGRLLVIQILSVLLSSYVAASRRPEEPSMLRSCVLCDEVATLPAVCVVAEAFAFE